jgi:hypothetical protein
MSFYVATLYSVVQLSADASGWHHDKLRFVMTKEECPSMLLPYIQLSN